MLTFLICVVLAFIISLITVVALGVTIAFWVVKFLFWLFVVWVVCAIALTVVFSS